MNTIDTALIHAFPTPNEWEKWLSEHHDKMSAIWLRFYKKNSGQKTITYDEALDVALCYGWIDGQAKGYDEVSYLQRFTPRSQRSNWSKVNTGHAERLIKEGRMQPTGLKQVEAAKADGRWERAYASPANAVLPEAFAKMLAKNKKAHAFYESLTKANKYAIIYRLTTAKKQETIDRRMKEILAMLERGEKFH